MSETALVKATYITVVSLKRLPTELFRLARATFSTTPLPKSTLTCALVCVANLHWESHITLSHESGEQTDE
jgi:hypothetical protein